MVATSTIVMMIAIIFLIIAAVLAYVAGDKAEKGEIHNLDMAAAWITGIALIILILLTILDLASPGEKVQKVLSDNPEIVKGLQSKPSVKAAVAEAAK